MKQNPVNCFNIRLTPCLVNTT